MAIEKSCRKHNRQKIHKKRIVHFTQTICFNEQKKIRPNKNLLRQKKISTQRPKTNKKFGMDPNTYCNEYKFYDTIEKNQVDFYLFTVQATN